MVEELTFAGASSLSIQIYGLAILISMLVAVVIRVIVGFLAFLEKKAKESEDQVPSGTSAVADESHDDHFPAIAAAVWAMVGAGRIVRIESADRGGVWAAEGRISHHSSHVVDHRPRHGDPGRSRR